MCAVSAWITCNADKAQSTVCECDSAQADWTESPLHYAGPTDTAFTHHHGAVNLSPDTVTNEIVLGGLADP